MTLCQSLIDLVLAFDVPPWGHFVLTAYLGYVLAEWTFLTLALRKPSARRQNLRRYEGLQWLLLAASALLILVPPFWVMLFFVPFWRGLGLVGVLLLRRHYLAEAPSATAQRSFSTTQSSDS